VTRVIVTPPMRLASGSGGAKSPSIMSNASGRVSGGIPSREFPLQLAKYGGRGVLVLALAVASGASTGCGSAAGDESEWVSPVDAEQDPRCDALTEGLMLSTQAEVDALEGCVSIEPSVWIEPRSGSIDLRPLARLRRVGGQLLIGCTASGFESSCDSNIAVTSLEGLNALEEAGRLQIAQLGARSVAPLARLRRVGFLGISACPELTDLRGLEQLEQVDQIEISQNLKLASLDGLAPLPMLRSILLDANPALVDIDALSSLTDRLRSLSLSGVPVTDLSAFAAVGTLEDLHVGGTAVRDFDALRLRHVDSISIDYNPLLEQVDVLGALESQASVTVTHNARLSRLPSFAATTEVFRFEVRYNPLLVQGPSFPNLVRGRSASITIEGNDSLTHFDGLRALESGGFINVIGNPALRALDLSALVEVDDLRILCNPQLPAEALAALDGVRGQVILPGDSEDACP
jgi:hypothetical protein